MVGILGGTFDPIHNGHLITARSVLESRKLEKIILVPCNISPHKQNVKTASNDDRFKMMQLAIEGKNYFELTDYELKKGGISYTIDTLKYFKKTYENIDLIIGYDNLIDFDTWKDYQDIFKIVNLVVMKRATDKISVQKEELLKHAIFVDTPVIEISASDIRSRILNNGSIDFLVPDNVKDYIFENKIYSGTFK